MAAMILAARTIFSWVFWICISNEQGQSGSHNLVSSDVPSNVDDVDAISTSLPDIAGHVLVDGLSTNVALGGQEHGSILLGHGEGSGETSGGGHLVCIGDDRRGWCWIGLDCRRLQCDTPARLSRSTVHSAAIRRPLFSQSLCSKRKKLYGRMIEEDWLQTKEKHHAKQES